MLFLPVLPVWWKWLHRKRRKELLEIMSEQNRQEEAARNDRQRLEQQAVESRQLSERALADAHWFSDLFAMAGRKFFQQYANYKGYSDKGTDRADRSRHQR